MVGILPIAIGQEAWRGRMADEGYRIVSREEFLALAAEDRSFEGLLLSPDLALDNADLAESRFERCLFQSMTVQAADFSEASFTDCRFEPSRFASCTWAKARLSGCSWFDADKKKGSTFAFCDLQAVEITKCNFATCIFERCDLYNLTAVDSSFRGVQFRQSTFSRAISKRSTLTKASFEGCNISFADLSGLFLQNCEFRSCKFPETSFIDSDLSGATLIGCDLDRVDWERAKLAKADLRGSSLSGLTLAVLTDYAGLKISDSEQAEILGNIGVEVHRSE
jgi:fluoroquinolone resistance protein